MDRFSAWAGRFARGENAFNFDKSTDKGIMCLTYELDRDDGEHDECQYTAVLGDEAFDKACVKKIHQVFRYTTHDPRFAADYPEAQIAFDPEMFNKHRTEADKWSDGEVISWWTNETDRIFYALRSIHVECENSQGTGSERGKKGKEKGQASHGLDREWTPSQKEGSKAGEGRWQKDVEETHSMPEIAIDVTDSAILDTTIHLTNRLLVQFEKWREDGERLIERIKSKDKSDSLEAEIRMSKDLSIAGDRFLTAALHLQTQLDQVEAKVQTLQGDTRQWFWDRSPYAKSTHPLPR